MRKILSSRFLNIGLILLVLILNIFAACEIGLGASVDTEAPTLEISSPPVDSIVRGDFALKGTWTDDGTISSVNVTLKRTDGYGSTLEYEAEVTDPEDDEEAGGWSVVINPIEAGILDGTYEALIEITDEAGHEITQTRIFSIDNTPPLIVLQRPGTKITETPDAYGQTFSLNGMGTDDNNIDHIDVAIYSDEACTNLLKTITKSNVPPTIELDVAVFENGVANDYSEIYGSTTKNGTQTRYCKITAYDNAVHYPVDASQASPTDEKGNSTSNYYLYDDIYSGILEEYTITDVYRMLSGTYMYSEKSRSADTVSSVRALLAQKKISQGNFSLNPENNPLFIVNGKDVLRKDGTDFAASDYDISSGEGVVIEISTGLDGISLNAASLRPYLLPCDNFGNPGVTDVAENRIYLKEAGTGAKSGTSYKFTVELDSTADYFGKSISIGNTYIFGVEGADQRGNSIIPKNGTYGFKLASNGAAPGLNITSPASTISYVGENGNQIFSGTVTCMDGLPTISIKNGTNTVWSHTFTESEGVTSEGIIHYDFSYTLDYNGQTENSQIQYTVEASLAGLKTTSFKTVIYDKDEPTIDINEPDPLASKYNRENESSPLVGSNYLNGTIKLKASVNDEYDAIDTVIEGKKPYFEIINAQTNAVIPVQLGADSHVAAESSQTDKHYITRLINGEYKINTTQIPDNTQIKFKFYAYDRAGNHFNRESSVYIVDQSTDNPVLLPDDSGLSLLIDSKQDQDDACTNWNSDNSVRRSQVPSGGQFMLKMIDDDGIKNWEIYRAELSTANQSEAPSNVEAGRYTLDSSSPAGSEVKSKEITKAVTVQVASGFYWYKVKIIDMNGKELTPNPVFLVKVTTAAPSITVSSVASDSDAAVGEYIGAAGASKTKWKNKIEIDSSESSFTVYRALSTDPTAAPVNSAYSQVSDIVTDSSNPKIKYDIISPTGVTANQTYYYYVIDNNGTESATRKSITCKYDGNSPTLSITNPAEGAKLGASAIDTASYQFKGTAEDDVSVSAIYYKSVTINSDGTYTAPEKPTSNLMTASSWTDLGWTAVTAELNWSFVIGSDSSHIPEGKYKFYMYALDSAGNISDADSTAAGVQPYSREYHVDTTAPVVTANALQYVKQTETDNRKVTITGTVQETYGLASFYIKRNDETGNGTSVTPAADHSWTYNNTPAADGTYTYTITATDLVGKTNQSLTKTVIVDTVLPTIDDTKIVVPTSTETENSLFKFEGNASCVSDGTTGSGLDKVELAFTSANTAPAANGAQASTTPASNGSWSSTLEFANTAFGNVFGSDGEGTKYLWVKVYDKAGNSSAWTPKSFTFDKSAPGFTLSSNTPVNNSYRNSGFTIEGTATDSYGLASVIITGNVALSEAPDNWTSAYSNYYTNAACTTPAPEIFAAGTYYIKQPAATSSTDSQITSALYSKAFRVGTETTAGATLLVDGSYNFTVTATDLANKTYTVNRTITIERVSPNLNNIRLITGVEAGLDVEAYRASTDDPYYINNTASTNLKISGVATDNIGLESVTISIPGSSYNGTNTGSAAEWKFEHINLSGMSNVSGQDATATITVTDKAGNTNTGTVNIYFDTTGPSGYHEVDSSEKNLYFRIGDNDNEDITPSDPLWNSSKDTDVGKKYSDKTYGNSDTVELRGNITDPQQISSTVSEAGSGVKMIYYRVFTRPVVVDTSYTTAMQDVYVDDVVVDGVSTNNVLCYGFPSVDSLTNYVIENKTGYFAPGADETKRVFYNVSGTDIYGGTQLTSTKYYKDVITNYRATISGFNNTSNYVSIAAVDNVGNRGLDHAVVTTPQGDLIKVYCQINKDVTPPSINLNNNEEANRYHNASAGGNTITFHGTVTDALAGIRDLKFRVNDKYIPNNEANQPADRYGTLSVSYSDDTKRSGTWTLTVNSNALAGTSGDISVYGIATDDAGTGNSQTVSVARICVDVTPPTITIATPKDRGSASGTQINGTINITGTASDRNGLKEETATQTMKLYYTTSSTVKTTLANALSAYSSSPATATYPTITPVTDASSGWKEIGSATHDSNWTFSNVNTTGLEITGQATTTVYFTAAAIDKAGNTGYAAPLTAIVDQNTDRPTVSLSNLDLGESMSSAADGYVWLKNTTKLIGTITDDDDDEAGNNVLKISLTGTDSDWHDVNVNGSSFSYDLKDLYTGSAAEKENSANGQKTIFFKVTDKKNKTFTSSTTNTTTALYISDGTDTYGEATSGVKIGSIVYVKVDTKYPEVVLGGAKYTNQDDTAYTTSYNSLFLGETNRSFKVRFTASDTNGIDVSSITGTAEFPYGTGGSAVTVNGTNIVEPSGTDSYYTMTFTLSEANVAVLKAGSGYEGSVNLRISVSDNASNVTPQTATLSYDFKPSVASFSNPDSSVSQSGEVEAYGSLSETATVSYKVTTSQTESATDEEWHTISDATGLNWTIHFDNNTNSANGTHAKSLNKYLIDYGLAEHDTGSQAPDAIVSSYETFTTLYLWIKTVDHAGNEKKFNHPILVDPQGDKPNLQFSYPAANNGTLGGTVSIYGTATDSKGSVSEKIGVDSVWVQIKSTTHRAAADTSTYGASPSYNSSTNTVSMTLTEADLDYMVNNGYDVYKRSSYVVGAAAGANDTHKWTTSRNLASGESADDYAILANISGAAWDIEINKNLISGRSEFDPPSGINTNPIAIRVYARDKDGKFSNKVERYVSFDADTPVISDLKIVQSTNANVSTAATATKTYAQDMFLKGQWYLTGTVTDNDKIKELKVNGETLVTYTESSNSETPSISTVPAWANAVSISADGKTINFKYPLFVNTNGSVSYSVPTSFSVSAKDAIKGNNAHEITYPLSIYYDNTSPSVVETAANGLNIDTSIRQSNRWYTFGSKAMEHAADDGTPQSGFAYTAFYFTRNNTLYDVLNDRNSSVVGNIGTIPTLGSEPTNAADNTIVGDNEGDNEQHHLYWYRKTISNISGQTFDVSSITGIRKSSLLQINGALYLVTNIVGTSITVDSPVPAGSSVAYVAIAGIINNTNAEGDGNTMQSDGYYDSPSRDDGDRMIESVDKSGTTWAWEAKICSRNIPDGPVRLHYIVFDKAGNSTHRDVDGMVSNNQPRIAGAIVKTDFNGDGDVDDDGETLNNYSTSLSYATYYTGTKTTGTAPNTVTKNVFDPDANVVNSNAKNPLPTATTYGEADNPITVLRGKTVIQPEIVGGNGALYYGYKVGDATEFTNNTAAAFIANGSTDYTVQTGSINIQLGDLIGFGDTTNAATGKLFEFKFWDSTEGGTRFSSSNPTQVAQLSMYFAVQAQTVGTPTVRINPFYWNSLKDNSIYGSATASAYKDLQGHIELEADWKNTQVYNSAATSGLYDDDPKVSGKIVLSGTAHDDKLIKEMNANIFGTSVSIASYSGGALASTKAESAFGTNHYWFEVVSQTIGSSGHDVNWKLYIDTATALSTVAGTDKTVTVTATNYGAPTATEVASTTAGAILSMNGSTYYSGTISYATGNSNTPGTTQTGKTKDAQNNPVLTAYYKMDVVPYITKISTGIRTASGLKDSNIRSASGKYSILANITATASQNAITVSGFNFYGTDIVAKIANSTVSAGSGITKDSGGVGLTISASSTSTATIANVSITNSGYLELFSNGVRALNNVNQNNAYGTATKKVSNVDTQITAANAVAADYENSYNREPDYYTTKNVLLTDDRYLRFFDMKNTGVKNGYYPVMIMNGNNPVFGYVNKSGGTSGTASVGNNTYAGSYNASHAMPQRSEFNGADGTRIDTEYLIKASTWDQMGMAVDEGGRYYNVSVYNRDGASMSLIYDRYNEIETPSQGYGWGAGTGYQGYTGSYSYYLKNNAITLEKVNYGGSLLTERFQYPKLIAKGDSTSDTENATIYMTYYDDATGEILFRDFRIGTEYASTYKVVKNDYSFTRGNYTGYGYLYGNSDDSLGNTYVKIGQDYYLLTSIGSNGSETVYRIEDYENTDATISSDIYIPMRLDNNGTDSNSITYNQGVNFIENYNNSSNYDNGRLSVVSTGSKYFDMGVTSDNHVVIAYVDSVTNNLVLKYSTNAVDGSNPVADVAWTTSTVSFPDNIGTYVSIALDGNAVHMAAFDGYDSNLVYMYLPSYNSAAGFKKVTVDQASAVGNWTQVKVKDGVPYIAYYNSTETGSRDCIKLAYPLETTGKTAVQNKENPGVDVEPGTAYAAGGSANGAATGYTTGAWEYMTVPAITPPQGGDPKFQNVCLDFDSAGRPVVGYLGTNLEFGKALDE